jgi:maleate isomerase
VSATSSVLTLHDAFREIGATRIGLVTPYLHDVQDKIVENFRSEGFDCVAERHLNDGGNFSFSQVSESTIAEMVRAVARERPHAITIFCTNLRGARIAAVLEKELDIPIYDTVATAVFGALRIAGKDPAEIEGWGSLFQLSHGIQARKTN